MVGEPAAGARGLGCDIRPPKEGARSLSCDIRLPQGLENIGFDVVRGGGYSLLKNLLKHTLLLLCLKCYRVQYKIVSMHPFQFGILLDQHED